MVGGKASHSRWRIFSGQSLWKRTFSTRCEPSTLKSTTTKFTTCSMIASQGFKYFKNGNKFRQIAKTSKNERSSRSHTIFRITIESKQLDSDVFRVSNLFLSVLLVEKNLNHNIPPTGKDWPSTKASRLSAKSLSKKPRRTSTWRMWTFVNANWRESCRKLGEQTHWQRLSASFSETLIFC